ncbi:response regulator [Thiococcus pfennigii]|uniref:response regulator n=1 Tax=Thiococcus pfennigii TaxID=1057 RepID=UPI001904FCA4|nr:response regulator [Thiococcus pfennigii]MBK1702801.1 hypothetical protein [Thiococcus pfennigii]
MANHDSIASNPLRLVYVGADEALAEALRTALRRVGATLVGIADAADPLPNVAGGQGTAVLVDTRAAASPGALAAAVAALKGRLGEGARVFCLAASGRIEARLEALRAGADGFFSLADEALAREALSVRLADLVRDRISRPRILIVDDQPVVALFAHRVLEKVGMEVRAVSDPLLVLDALVRFRPDLILMDLHMPGVSGIELTRIIRDHDELHSIPIVFFSSEADPATQLETLRVGGDDFLPKPILPDRLIAVVQDRLSRSREQQGHAPESGVFERRAFLGRLEGVLADLALEGAGYGLLLLAPDRPFTIGEAAGVLDEARWRAQFASGLVACLEATDVLAALAESGLGVLARRADRAALVALGERLREVATGLLATGQDQGGTASVGLAPLDSPGGDALALLSRAESALGEARRSGGGRLVVHVSAVPRRSADGREAHLAGLVERALREEALELYFQPIAPLRRPRGEPYDVWLRLRAPDGELLSPGDFLPAAERGGRMAAIDRWVLDRALAVQQCVGTGHDRLRLVIQQRLATFADARAVEDLRDLIVARDLIRQRPLLRFSCAELLADTGLATEVGEALGRLGIGICADLPEDTPAVWRLLERLRPALVRLPCQRAVRLGRLALRAQVDRLHAAGALVMVAGIEDPLAISEVWHGGVDLIQGNFVQPAGPHLDFDFAGTVLEA